jgi:hypothetical protein
MNTKTNKKPSRRFENNHYDGTKDRTPVMRYVPSGNGKPMRYGNLRAGSFFSIFAEPSRRIYTSTDKGIYQKSVHGNYSEHVGDHRPAILDDRDLVVPHKLVRIQSAD